LNNRRRLNLVPIKTASTLNKNQEVYNLSKKLSPEQKDIARYWDDNPFVVEYAGHIVFANNSIRPVTVINDKIDLDWAAKIANAAVPGVYKRTQYHNPFSSS